MGRESDSLIRTQCHQSALCDISRRVSDRDTFYLLSGAGAIIFLNLTGYTPCQIALEEAVAPEFFRASCWWMAPYIVRSRGST